MRQDEIEYAILRLAKACNLLAAAIEEIKDRQDGKPRPPPRGLLSLLESESLLSAVRGEIEAVVDMVEGKHRG